MNLDGTGTAEIATGVGFFDHMLTLLAKHAAFDLTVKAAGDLHVDQHHTVEDVGICLGQAVREALGDKAGIRRYGHFTLPMEETLVTSGHRPGRPGVTSSSRPNFPRPRSASSTASWSPTSGRPSPPTRCATCTSVVHYGRNSHHIAEAIFKATARALRMAVEPDPRMHRRAEHEGNAVDKGLEARGQGNV